LIKSQSYTQVSDTYFYLRIFRDISVIYFIVLKGLWKIIQIKIIENSKVPVHRIIAWILGKYLFKYVSGLIKLPLFPKKQPVLVACYGMTGKKFQSTFKLCLCLILIANPLICYSQVNIRSCYARRTFNYLLQNLYGFIINFFVQ